MNSPTPTGSVGAKVAVGIEYAVAVEPEVLVAVGVEAEDGQALEAGEGAADGGVDERAARDDRKVVPDQHAAHLRVERHAAAERLVVVDDRAVAAAERRVERAGRGQLREYHCAAAREDAGTAEEDRAVGADSDRV